MNTPDHARLQQQEHGVILLGALLNAVPGTKYGHESHQRGEHHQQQADAVHADVIVRAQGGDPVGALLELEAGDTGLEPLDQGKGNQEPGESRQVGPDPDQVLALRRDEEQHRQTGQGREEDDAQ